MPEKPEMNACPALPEEAARRLARFAAVLESAAADLAHGDPEPAEKAAKAVSALMRATKEVEEWIARAAEAARQEEADDGEALIRELESRLNRFRVQAGLEPLFEEPDGR